MKIALGIGGPALIAVVWATWMAPRSSRRAPEGARLLLEVLIFGGGALALAAAAGPALTLIFAVIAAVSTAVDHLLAREV